MKTRRRSKRGLPSPLELSFYLFAVIVFCIINWALLKANDPVKRSSKSFESMIVESMLDQLDPVTLSKDQDLTSDVSNFAETGEQAIELESWMISLEAFTQVGTENEIAIEDWMVSTSAWRIPQP